MDIGRTVTEQSGACAGRRDPVVTNETISALDEPDQPMPDYRLGCEDDDGRPVLPACADPDGRCGCGQG